MIKSFDKKPFLMIFKSSLHRYFFNFKIYLISPLFFFSTFVSAQFNCTEFDVQNFVLNGHAFLSDSTEVTLTSEQGNLYGTMWSDKKIRFDEDFTIESELYLGIKDGSGADGIAFVLQPLSSNQGLVGGGIGYQGISPSLAIEFDTWFNSGADPMTDDHVAIIKNGETQSLAGHSEFIDPINVGNIENGAWYPVKIEFTTSTNQLKLTFNGNELFDIPIDLQSIFPLEEAVYWGFTAATGGANNLQKVRINNYCVIPEDCVNSPPIGNSVQIFCNEPIIADLEVSGQGIVWYDAPTEGNLLDSDTLLTDGQYVYASQSTNECESSERLEIQISILDIQIASSENNVCSGSEVVLTVDYPLPTICDLDITLSDIPLGEEIPGFSYGGFYNNHHYYVYNTPTAWTEGEQICRENGGYLVCINDEAENTYVSNLTENNIWIGMFRDPETCEFRWLDCMDISYTNWRPGEPNSDPCGEPYVQIIRGCSFGYNTWNNLGDNSSNGSCYSNMVPIMEIDPALYQPNSGSNIELIWSTGETEKSISVNPNETTEYWVDILINGQTVCREYITVTVEEPIELPALDTFICLPFGQSISDIPTNGAQMNWYDSPEFGYLIPGSYVPVEDQIIYGSVVNPLSGCESPDRIALEINLIDTYLDYNNLITVDGNDSNNSLKISGVERFPENRMEIYNRYGNLVWTVEGYDNLNKVFEGAANVDGVFSKGSFLPSGTYFFLLRYSNICTNSELKGFFHLDNRI